MKKIIAIVTVLASLSAFAGFVTTINGKISGSHTFTCTLTNNTGRDLDVKRVSFNLEKTSGRFDTREVTYTQSVNNVIYTGETSSVTLTGVIGNFHGRSCQFVVRK